MRKLKIAITLIALALGLCLSPNPSIAASPATVDLGTAGNFVVLAKSGISTTGATLITGNIGVSPIDSTAITGFGLSMDASNVFSTSSLVVGNVYAADYTPPTPANMTTAVSNMQTAYTDAAGRAADVTELGAGDISGLTLAPGVYKWGTGVLIAADLTLSGGPNDVWIFQIAQNLTVSSGVIVHLIGGAQAKNIFWQVGSNADIGTTAQFEGTILSLTDINLQTGAKINGGLLAQTAVTLHANIVSKPTYVVTVTGPTSVGVGVPITLAATTSAGLIETYTWSSSDVTTATVVNGVVTGLKSGVVTISATGNTSAQVGTYLVSVATKVIIAGASTMAVGATNTLTATTIGVASESYSWTSSNLAIATISNAGVVTGINRGYTTIIATGLTSGLTGTFLLAVGERWEFIAGAAIHSSPAVSGNFVYFGSDDNKVYSVNTTTGIKAWEFLSGGLVESSPTVSGGFVYVGSFDNKLYCLNALTGVKSWEFLTAGTVKSSPAVVGTQVFFGSSDFKVYSVNTTTGLSSWSFTTGGAVTSSPAVSGNNLYVGSADNKVYCLDINTGAKNWEFLTGGAVNSSPAVSGNSLFVGSSDNKLYCLNMTTGAKLWEYASSGVLSSPAVYGTYVYFSSSDFKVYCLNASTGAKIWQYDMLNVSGSGPFVSSPVVSNGYVYVGCQDWNLYCLRAFTGAKLWSAPGLAGFFSSPAVSSGMVYIGGADKMLHAIYAGDGDTGSWPMFHQNTNHSGVQVFPTVTVTGATQVSFGGSTTLTAATSPLGYTDTYTWASNNTGLATVSEGVVFGRSPGVVVITATGRFSKISGTFSVTVGSPQTTPGPAPSPTPTPLPILFHIKTISLPDGTRNALYSTVIEAEGGSTPYQYSITSGNLPTGLTLFSTTGAISGIPVDSGNFKITFSAKDAKGQTALWTLSLLILESYTPIDVTPISFSGNVGEPFDSQIMVKGGIPPYTLSLPANFPVPGLTMSSSGRIYGVPTEPFSGNVVLTVIDATNQKSTFVLESAFVQPPVDSLSCELLVSPELCAPGESAKITAYVRGTSTVDAYLAKVQPDGSFSCLLPSGQWGTLNQPKPIATNWKIISGSYALNDYLFTDKDAPGEYTFYAIFTNPGVSPLDSKNWLSWGSGHVVLAPSTAIEGLPNISLSMPNTNINTDNGDNLTIDLNLTGSLNTTLYDSYLAIVFPGNQLQYVCAPNSATLGAMNTPSMYSYNIPPTLGKRTVLQRIVPAGWYNGPYTAYFFVVNKGADPTMTNNWLRSATTNFTIIQITASSPVSLNLGTAGNFAVLSKSGISTTGTTLITGDIGVSPIDSTGITGFGLSMDASNQFSTSSLVVGKVYAADYTPPSPANLTTAVSDMETAYTDAAGRAPNVTELGAGNISGMTLVPGVYKWGTGLLLASDITLSGGANDVWIFQIAQNLTVSGGVSIHLTGGAQAKNVFWQVGSNAEIGSTAKFQGTILAKTSISFLTGASINGRLLSQTAVTLQANAVTKPTP